MFQLFLWNPLQSYKCHLPCGITVLHVTRHRRMHPTLTPARQASTRFTYHRAMKSKVDLRPWC